MPELIFPTVALVIVCVLTLVSMHYGQREEAALRRIADAHERIRLAQEREALARRRVEVAVMRLAVTARDRHSA